MNTLLPQEKSAWIKVGARQSIIQGGKASGIYIVLATLGVVGSTLFNSVSDTADSTMIANQIAILGGVLLATLAFSTPIILLGGLVGIMPSICIGAVSGALLGACLSIPYIHAHRWNRIAVGFGIAIIAALQVNLVLMPLFTMDEVMGVQWYVVFLGIPTLVYIATLVRLSDQLPDVVRQSLYHHETPVYPY